MMFIGWNSVVLCCKVRVGTVVLIAFGMDAVSTGNHMWPQRALVEIKLTVVYTPLIFQTGYFVHFFRPKYCTQLFICSCTLHAPPISSSVSSPWFCVCVCVCDMIYLLTAIGLSPGGSTHLHTNNI